MPASSPTARQSGFSLIELLIGMLIAIEILVAALTVFDVHNRMARIQMQITDMQQSLRVAQYDMVRTTRMAGRGGLPIGSGIPSPSFTVDNAALSVPWLRGLAVEFRDNVATGGDNQVALGTADPLAVPGTDILTVRGCLSGLLFQMDPKSPADFSTTTLQIRTTLPNGRTQDLTELLEPGFSGMMLLQSAINRSLYMLPMVTATGIPADGNGVALTIAAALPAGFVPGFACTVEEYRYYIREAYETAPDDTIQIKPRLARARMIPFTELPYAGAAANLSLDLADDIFDLQIALGFDTDFDSAASGLGSFESDDNAAGADDLFFEGATDAARATDDWFGNSSADNPTAAQYRVNAAVPGRGVRLYYVRISTLARTARRDPKYSAPDFDPVAGVDFIENHDYDAASTINFKSLQNRQYRHRLLQTVVDLRNI